MRYLLKFFSGRPGSSCHLTSEKQYEKNILRNVIPPFKLRLVREIIKKYYLVKETMSSEQLQEGEQHFQPIATFILKTFAILSSPQNAQAIAWHPDGSCFIIRDTTRIVKEVLPRYFRHHKYESFIRQLNMYNFSKVKSSEGPCFANYYFKKDRDDLLKYIKRKPERKKRKNLQNQELSENFAQNEKENTIKLISESDFPAKTKDQIEEVCMPAMTFIRNQTMPVLRAQRKVTFAEDVKDLAQENLSTMMEPSRKWLNSKEESCWQNIKSSKSIKISMQLLSFQDEADGLEEIEPVLRVRRSAAEAETLKCLPLN